jgi:Protein of unknown function (DUF1360)
MLARSTLAIPATLLLICVAGRLYAQAPEDARQRSMEELAIKAIQGQPSEALREVQAYEQQQKERKERREEQLEKHANRRALGFLILCGWALASWCGIMTIASALGVGRCVHARWRKQPSGSLLKECTVFTTFVIAGTLLAIGMMWVCANVDW